MENAIFSITGILQLRWKDENLKWGDLFKANLSSKPLKVPFDLVWHPVILNDQQDFLAEKSTNYLLVDKDGTMFINKGVELLGNCYGDLWLYDFIRFKIGNFL